MKAKIHLQRTLRQNNALHKYFEMVAETLNEAGLEMKKVLENSVDIPWSKETIKELIWRPIQEAQLKKKSTTKLSVKDVDIIFETVNRFLSTLGIHIPFPSFEAMLVALGNKRNQ